MRNLHAQVSVYPCSGYPTTYAPLDGKFAGKEQLAKPDDGLFVLVFLNLDANLQLLAKSTTERDTVINRLGV